MRNFIFCISLFVWSSIFTQNKNRVIDSLENRIKTLTDSKEIFSEKSSLLLKYYTTGNHDKARDILNETYRDAVSQKSDYGMAAYYNTKAILLSYEANFDSSLYYFEKALEIRKKLKDDKGVLRSLSNLGTIHNKRKEYKKAIDYFEEALKLETEMGFEEGKHIALNSLGTIYFDLKMYDKALFYFRKAQQQHIKNNDEEKLMSSYDGFRLVYKDIKKFDSALYYANKSKDLAIKLNDQRILSYANLSISNVYTVMKNYSEAKKYIKQAEQVYKQAKLNDEHLLLAIYGYLAAAEVNMNNTDSALVSIEKVVELQKKLNTSVQIAEMPKLFAEYYYLKKDYKNAYNYLLKQNTFNDSTYKSDISLQLNEMRTKYETEKKEQENKLLQHENKQHKTTRNYLLIILAIAVIGIIGAIVAYRKIKRSKELISFQKQIVEEKQKEILDSINYARRIQYALLASDNLLEKHLPEYFVVFKPKDVVSGDFYWATPTKDGFIYVTGDCTGHGVPGAFMSLLNISKLNQAINEHNITQPNLILNNVRNEIVSALNPEGSKEVSKDGMDAVVCKLDIKNMKLQFSAANNSFYIIRNNTLITCKADKMPVGKGHDDSVSFSFNEIELQKGDIIYTFTDGFADQFGGAHGKKFKYKPFEELLLAIHHEPMEVQKQKIEEAFVKWKGTLEQVDDVCVIGVRV